MKKAIPSLLMAGALAVSASLQAATIDDFDGAATLIIDADGSQNAAYGNAIGGSRTVSITKSGSLGASAGVIVPPGVYSHSADALTSAISTITWDANGAGLGGIDIVEGLTNNVFAFDIQSIDQGNIDLILSVTDTLSNTSSFTFSGAGVGIQEVAFANFAGIDFTSIDAISLTVDGAEASDLILDSLGTSGDQVAPPSVPEPAAVWLIGAGLLGFVGFRAKKSS